MSSKIDGKTTKPIPAAALSKVAKGIPIVKAIAMGGKLPSTVKVK